MSRKIYIIGALSNKLVPRVAAALRAEGHDVFDDWYAAGPLADTHWREHEQSLGNSFVEGLQGPNAVRNFGFDKLHLDWCDTAILVGPAGKSCHLELGYCIGKGKESYILLPEEPEKWDLMYRFADAVLYDVNEVLEKLSHDRE